MQAILRALSIVSFTIMAATVSAQSYPSGAINLVIPLAAGDTSDVAGRTINEELSKLLKVPIITVNRPGAGGTLGTDSAVKAKKDGYTLLFANNAALIFNRILTPESVAYDPLRDLTPLGLATRFPLLLAVRQDAPYKNFSEMVEYSKKNPGKVRVATVGSGSVGHFTVEIINSLTGAGLTMVPFKGASPGVTAILGGHVEGGALALGMVSSHMKAGTMRGVLVSSKIPDFADIPTLSQLGYRQNLLGVWTAFFAPAGVPAEVTKVLVPAVEKAVKDPTIASKLAALGVIPEYAPPEKLVVEIREEHKIVEEIAKKAGLIK
ncbi:MAG TPA: tripartite tricarboxylate transporter substrate binding protein [Candidatus Binatia bacterium]|jgi:tripartite-type tricarboxylate transporter receptor subunit TctC|nr:tripartite tricarboxylate transporter substrate binding protein [Candidatus Binatia bacterium]